MNNIWGQKQIIINTHIPCGICITATVKPLTISLGKSDFKLYLCNHDNIGNVFIKHLVGLTFLNFDINNLPTIKIWI